MRNLPTHAESDHRPHRRSALRLSLIVAGLGLILAACGGSNTSAGEVKPVERVEVPAQDQDVNARADRFATVENNDGGRADRTGSDRIVVKEPEGRTGPDDFAGPGGPHLIAPYWIGEPGVFVIWDDAGIGLPTPDPDEGHWILAEVPHTEVADAGPWGVVFMRPGDENTIWRDSGLGLEVVLSVPAGDRIVLEGVAVPDLQVPVIYYRHQKFKANGDIRRDVLRQYNMTNGEDARVAAVADADTSTRFNLIHRYEAVSVSVSEGRQWVNYHDLRHHEVTELFACDLSDTECPELEAAAWYDGFAAGPNGAIIAMFKDDPDAATSDYHLVMIDPHTGYRVNLHTFAWEQGVWEVEDLFISRDVIIISVEDGDGNPLPPAAIEMESGEVGTFGQRAFYRHYHRSDFNFLDGD